MRWSTEVRLPVGAGAFRFGMKSKPVSYPTKRQRDILFKNAWGITSIPLSVHVMLLTSV
jgi:hypothetical protein